MDSTLEDVEIEESYSLSVDELTAYIVTNCKNPNLEDNIVIATGFEYFVSNDDIYVCLIYPLGDIIEHKINFVKLDPSTTCDICKSGIEKPMASIYKFEKDVDEILNDRSEIKRLPSHMRSFGFDVCEKCQSSIVEDLYVGLPDQYKVSHNI